MAAIGVRGTETVMVYNDKSDKFTMGGLTGEVIAVALKKGQDLKIGTLNKIIQPGNPVAFQVPPKNFSSISVKDGKTKITKPQVMNTTQFHALRRNEVPKFESQNKKESQKGDLFDFQVLASNKKIQRPKQYLFLFQNPSLLINKMKRKRLLLLQNKIYLQHQLSKWTQKLHST